MKKLKNLKTAKTLSKKEQQSINGGNPIVCRPNECCGPCYRGFCNGCPPRHQF